MTEQSPSGQLSRLLVVGDPAGPMGQWLPLLRERGAVREVATAEEALAALRDDDCAFVLTTASELLPIARAASRERASSLLEGVGQGVCIVDPAGRLLFANAALRAYPPQVTEAMREAVAARFEELRAERGPEMRVRSRNQRLHVAPDYVFELSVSALPRADGGFDEAVGLFSDVSDIERLHEKLDAIDSAGRELVSLEADATALLDVGERLHVLEEKVIRYCRELLHFTHFAVMVLDPKTNTLETVLGGGFSEEALSIKVHAKQEGNGISGYVAATGQAYICPDISKDPLYLPGFEAAASSLTVPLRIHDRIVGVLNVESDKLSAFTEEDRQFAEIFARYIAAALHMLKLLAAERSETTGQVAADVSSELAAPLNDIVASVSRLLDQTTDAEDVKQRLRAIIEQVDRVKRAVQVAGQAPAIRGLSAASGEEDPLLAGKRVLIADDETIIRETIADVLARTGALVVMAGDGVEAVTMLRAQRFDLVLSDIKMPNKNGYEVFAVAKEVNAHCPVVLITGFGYDPEHSIVRASREGLAGVLFKPFKVEQLMDLVHKALGAPAGAKSG